MSSILELLRANLDQSYPPAPKFTEDDVPDLTGKVIIVTGGNTGIGSSPFVLEGLHNSRTSSAYVGKETARVVLAHNAKVYIACRSAERAHAAIADLKKVTGKNDIHFLSLDLASFASIRSAAEEFKRCDILIHIQILSY